MVPVLLNSERREKALRRSSQNPKLAEVLRVTVGSDPEIRQTAVRPGTDEDVVAALIWRYLMDEIFGDSVDMKPLPALEEATSRIKMVKELENMMNESALNPQGMNAASSINLKGIEVTTDQWLATDIYVNSVWRAQALFAIVNDPKLEDDRQSRNKTLATRLARGLMVFLDPWTSESRDKFIQSLQSEVIEPAIRFHKFILCERHLYYVSFDSYLSPDDGTTVSPEFYSDLRNLDCRVVEAKRQKPLDKMISPSLPKEDLENGLTKLCTTTPALNLRSINATEGIGNVEILKKQVVLVLWKPDFSGLEEPTFFFELANFTEV